MNNEKFTEIKAKLNNWHRPAKGKSTFATPGEVIKALDFSTGELSLTLNRMKELESALRDISTGLNQGDDNFSNAPLTRTDMMLLARSAIEKGRQ